MLSTVTLPPTKLYDIGREWQLKDIWRQSKKLKIKAVKVDDLWDKRYAKVFCWTLHGEEINNEFFLHHLERVLNADLTYPIILSEEDYILDGVHRLMKCKFLKIKYISCVQFKKDPKPNQ
tara:strand:+ start:105 stop:464 length:360 start_codon:yes stop_codon:yes gene_type:complete